MATKKAKYHFEGKRQDQKGRDVYVLIDLKTSKEITVDQKTFEKKEAAGEVER